MFISLIYLLLLKLIFSQDCKERQNFCSECNKLKNKCIKCEKDIYIPNNNGGCTYSKKCKTGKNNCMECYEEDNLCKICESEYYPDEYGGCSYTNNCIISERGQCLKCRENYVLIGIDNYFNNGIKLCKSIFSEDLKNCETISNDNGTCIECNEGYYLGYDDKKCTNIENCDESVNGICKTCRPNYCLNIKENKCMNQNDGPIFLHCKESLDGKVCVKCEEGYYFDEYGKCVWVKNCAKRTNNGVCKKCKNGYYLSKTYNSCTPEKNCYLGYKDFSICNSCKENYYIDLKDNKCKSNKDNNNFKYCKVANGDLCIECVIGYYIGVDNKCSTTFECVESDNGICLLCKEGHHLTRNHQCTKIEHCTYSYFYNECSECEENYYYDTNNKTCKLIEEENLKNCKEGREGYLCQECRDDYYLNLTDNLCYSNWENNEFYKCSVISLYGNRCLRCIEGYYLGNKDNKCSKIKECLISENENKCLECNINYCLNLKNGSCVYNNEIYNEEEKFYFRCKQTNKEGNSCEICYEGYSPNENGLCVDSIHCEEKDQENRCMKCQNNEFGNYCLNKYFGCVKIYDKGCFECNDFYDFSNCTKCLEGFDLDQNNYCYEIEDL